MSEGMRNILPVGSEIYSTMSVDPKVPASQTPASAGPSEVVRLARNHLRWGWWTMLAFLSLGIVLEAFHAFKVQWYLNVANETRRLMFTLAHAHGTLLSLIHIALGCCLLLLQPGGSWKAASRCLTWASLLIPGGFLLGGIVIFSGDPGIGILLLPVGAVMLVIAVFLIATKFNRSS
jgi:hypothetical protein